MPRRGGIKAAWIGAGLSLVCALAELSAGPGYRLGWWGLGAGLQTLRWAATAASAVFVLAFAGTVMAYRWRMRRGIALCEFGVPLSRREGQPSASGPS